MYYKMPIATFVPDEKREWREENSNLSRGTVLCKVCTFSHNSMKRIVQLKKR